MRTISSFRSCSQLTGKTAVWYFSFSSAASSIVSSLYGFCEFNRMTYGFAIAFSSSTVCSSAFTYAFRGSSPIVPSVVTTIPIVAWSRITFWVPIDAAVVNGISCSDHGVFTMRLSFPSIWPDAPSTINPTQSIRRTFIFGCAADPCIAVLGSTDCESAGCGMPALLPGSSGKMISAASCGINFGSVVMIVFPAADCGNSSIVRSRACSSSINGSTIRSINRLINVDFPVRTGPTTPM